MRLSFAMAITMAALAVYLQNMDLRAAATLFPSTLGALLAPRCALRALLCAPSHYPKILYALSRHLCPVTCIEIS